MESRTQPSRPRTQKKKKFEAKDRLFADRPSRGQGHGPRIQFFWNTIGKFCINFKHKNAQDITFRQVFDNNSIMCE